jgi:hypothetical protein
MTEQFDVFLSHDSRDKPVVEDIAARLRAEGIRVWLDKDELRPGLPWHLGLEEGIRASRSVAVFIGQHNQGAWQGPEMWAFVDRSRRERTPVIPVLLPDCPESAELDLFLRAFTWVDFRGGLTDDGIALLVWGITGVKPSWARPSLTLETGAAPRAFGLGRLLSSAPPPGTNPDRSGHRRPKLSCSLAISLALVLGALATYQVWVAPIGFWPKKPDLYEVRVQLLDPDGRPVSGGKIRTSTGNEALFLPQDGWWEIQVPRAKVPKDGKVTLWAEHDDWESNQPDLVLRSDRNVQARIHLKPPQSTIRGRVVDENNHALAGVKIAPQDGTPGGATSEPDGTFALVLPVPRERRIGLRAELKGWAPDTTYCYAGRDGCQVVLTKP